MVKITFNDERVEAEAIVELGRKIRVYCLPGGIYEIPAGSTALLDELGFSYQIVALCGWLKSICQLILQRTVGEAVYEGKFRRAR